MATRHHGNLPWLDHLEVSLPGYGGYQKQASRREADRTLRHAIVHRLRAARAHLEQAKHECVRREAQTEADTLERVERQLDRLLERLGRETPGLDMFTVASDLGPAEADSLHALDLSLLERADLLSHRFEMPDSDHNRLAEFVAGLYDLEKKFDRRALLQQGMT
jgi:hypothetical protein